MKSMRDVRTGSPAGAIEELLRSGEPLDDRDMLQLHRHYFSMLCGYAKTSGGTDPEGAANLALFDAFRAHARRPIVDEPAFRSYLCRATKSHVINESRRRVPVPTLVDDDLLDVTGGCDGHAQDEVIEREWLSEVFDQLPEDHQAVLNLRVVEGWSAEEVGHRLGRAPNAVYQLQHRAQHRLRQLVLVALLVIAIAAGSAALWQLSAPSSQVITPGPADQPNDNSLSPTSTTGPVGADGPAQGLLRVLDAEVPAKVGPDGAARTTTVAPPSDADGGDGAAPSPPTVDAKGTDETDAEAAGRQGPSTEDQTTAEPGSQVDPSGANPATTVPGNSPTKPAPPVSPEDEPAEPSTATTVADSVDNGTTTTAALTIKGIPIPSDPPPSGDPFNVCFTAVSDGMLHLKLYDPTQAPNDAEFIAPSAIRLTIEGDEPGTSELHVVRATTQATNLGWIAVGGAMTIDQPDGRTIWGAEIGPAGTVFTQLEYKSSATGNTWQSSSICAS